MKATRIKKDGSMVTIVRADFYIGLKELAGAVRLLWYMSQELPTTRAAVEAKVRNLLYQGGVDYFNDLFEKCSTNDFYFLGLDYDLEEDELEGMCIDHALKLFPDFKNRETK